MLQLQLTVPSLAAKIKVYTIIMSALAVNVSVFPHTPTCGARL